MMMAFPCDLVVEILSKLPVESLVRFKSVRKSWNLLFDDRGFVAKHLRNQKQQFEEGNNKYVLFETPYFESSHRVFSLPTKDDDDDDDDDDDRLSELKFPFSGEEARNVILLGHCNGLICFEFDKLYERFYVLWNPAIREFRFLPKLIDIDFSLSKLIDGFEFIAGFGYDPKSDDYKVIRMVVHQDLRQTEKGYKYQHPRVFSLSTDSWRDVDATLLKDVKFVAHDHGIYLNGFFCWRAMTNVVPGSEENVILSFDMSNEVFQCITMPPGLRLKYGSNWRYCMKGFRITVWKKDDKEEESIALILNELETAGVVEIWVMDGDQLRLGGTKLKGSWRKQFVMSLQHRLYPVIFLNNDELLCRDYGAVKSYNVNTHQDVKRIIFPGGHNVKYNYVQALSYMKSLVPVKRPNISPLKRCASSQLVPVKHPNISPLKQRNVN